ncbi:MAG TPA: LamG domain-containing protein [Baekduia sp.]|uniref:LamG domain-containing protein n=1 Tax=Baekduia sp. TaxID=2600305 RepID=UPI002D76AF85|nr:LamG domain-containing protein [Baekduia sp.]HET6505996.1 LamG domain-containing protein [Baekduia sp.]
MALVAPSIAGAEPSSVVGQWRFDEGSGQTVLDDGPYALDGRLGQTDGVDANDPTRIAGLNGGALRFGGQAFVRLPAAPELRPATLTLEAVVRADRSPGSYRYIVSHGAQGCEAGSYGLYTARDGGVAFYVFDGSSYYLTPAAAPADVWNGAWHHVAGVFDGSALRLYVDGRPVGGAFSAPHPIAYNLTSDDHYFGIYQGTCTLPLTGDVDLVRMWLGPLAPEKIGSLADEALAPRAPGDTTPPGSVPTANQADSDASAPQVRPELTPIAPGTVIGARSAATSGAPVRSSPGAPTRACQVKPSLKSIRAGRRTTLTVRVALRGTPQKGVRVVAMVGRSRVAAGRTAANGQVRLAIKTAKRGTIRLKAAGRADCATGSLSVLRATRKR